MNIDDNMVEIDIIIDQLMNDLEKVFNLKYIKRHH